MANALNKVNSGGIEDGSIVNADIKSDAAIAGSKLVAATTSVPGSMSAADKTKLDGVATSATANPSAPALTGSTNNTICTVTGANAIAGEANLTFDGSLLGIGTANPNSSVHASGSDAAGTRFLIQSTSATVDPSIAFVNSGNTAAYNDIAHITTDIENGNAQGGLIFKTRSADGSGNDAAERLRIDKDGKVGIGTTSPTATAISSNTINGVLHIDSSGADSGSVLKLGGKDGSSNSNYVQLGWAGANNRFDITVNGNQALRVEADKDVTVVDGDLIIGTSGHGIDFSATGDGSGTDSSELFDDYEEGTFTPTMPNSGSASFASVGYAKYTKVGRQVFWELRIQFQSSLSNYAIPDNSDTFQIGGLPYSADGYGGGVVTYGDGSDLSGSNSISVLVWSSNAIIYFHFLTTDSNAPTNAWARAKWSGKFIILAGHYAI
jgi:hypothetical protein